MIVDFVSGALDFDPANFTGLTAAQIQTAVERQDLIENKVAVALHFVDTLGTNTNITTTPPELDQAYLASVAVLKDVTHESATLTAANALIDAANASGATPISFLLNPPPSGFIFTAKAANTDFQTNDGANDADEGNNTSTGADTINATAAQVSDAATTIDGLQLLDSLNITNTTGANTADLTNTAASIENVEAISIGAGVSQLNLLSADIAGNTGGEIATLTGDARATQKLEIEGSVDLTGISNSNIEAISITDTAGTGVSVTIDTANLSGVTRLVLDDTNVGGNDSLILSGAGTFDFSSIALNFDSTGTNTLSIVGGLASTLTVDDADLDNISALTGDTTVGVINTLNFTGVGAKGDLSGMVVTDIDTVTISGTASTLTLEEASLSDSQFTTITGAGDSNLIFNEGGPSQPVNLTNTTISGFTHIFVDGLNNFDTVVLDAESIASGSVTLHGGADSKIQFTETDDVTGLVVNSGDFKGIILDAGVDIIANSGLLDMNSGTYISGAGATSSSLTINTSTASLDLATYTVGSNADDENGDINIVINGMAGNDTITGVSFKSAGSSMSINIANGGSDVVRLEGGSGNVADGMVIANAVSITGFDGANDQINIKATLANGAGIASVASNSVDANTAISIINNAFIPDFSNLAQLGTTVGTYANGTAGDKFIIAVSNNSSQTAIYSITENGMDLARIDSDDTVTLLGIITHTGTFDTTDINLY
jgi:hypothetical protein